MTIDATAGGRVRPDRYRGATQSPPRLAKKIVTVIWISLVAMLALGFLLERNIWTALLFGGHAVLISPPLARVYRRPRWLRLAMAWTAFAAGVTVIGFANASVPNIPPLGANPAPLVKLTQAERILSDESEFVDLQLQAKEQLSAILKDPDSARYQNVVAVSPLASHGHVSFCGQVNAKNSFGGYTGYTRFFIAPGVGAWLRNSPGIKFNEVWRTFCRNEDVISRAAGFN